jgi:hypothetical protein
MAGGSEENINITDLDKGFDAVYDEVVAIWKLARKSHRSEGSVEEAKQDTTADRPCLGARSAAEEERDRQSLIRPVPGSVGRCVSRLAPCGSVEIDGFCFSARSTERDIAPGSQIVVTCFDPWCLFVEETTPQLRRVEAKEELEIQVKPNRAEP